MAVRNFVGISVTCEAGGAATVTGGYRLPPSM
jgi:hypothetical protein